MAVSGLQSKRIVLLSGCMAALCSRMIKLCRHQRACCLSPWNSIPQLQVRLFILYKDIYYFDNVYYHNFHVKIGTVLSIKKIIWARKSLQIRNLHIINQTIYLRSHFFVMSHFFRAFLSKTTKLKWLVSLHEEVSIDLITGNQCMISQNYIFLSPNVTLLMHLMQIYRRFRPCFIIKRWIKLKYSVTAILWFVYDFILSMTILV